MSTTTFTNNVTLTDADWFNDVDAAIYQGTFPTGATALTVTGATTLAVFNTIATTVNAFGAATTLNIGNASGATTLSGTLSITKATTTNSATATPAGGNNAYGFVMGSVGVYVTWGSGAPTLSTAKGSLYLRTDGSTTNDRMYVNTDGGTTWTAVTTVA